MTNLGNNILWNFESTQKDAPKKAVDTVKHSYLLVNQPGDIVPNVRYGQSSVDNMVYLDWDLDGDGFVRKTDGDNTKSQATLKNIFTEKQESGYGSHIYDYIGIKDLGARRLSLFMDLSMAMLIYKANLNSEAARQNLSSDDLLSTITSLSVTEDETDIRAMRIKLMLQSASGAQLPLTVL